MNLKACRQNLELAGMIRAAQAVDTKARISQFECRAS
jgi:hypothetical protein